VILSLMLALGANLSFSTASLFYASYTEKYSAEWMNYFKAIIATLGFALVVFVFGFHGKAETLSYILLIISGSCGLFIGDIFLLKAMASIGAGRTLMLFGFSPLILGVSAYFLFDQTFDPQKLIAVLCLVGCLWSFALEGFKSKGKWEVKGLMYAMIGVLLDNAGVLMTRQSFELSPEMSPFQANLVRAFATVVGFSAMALIPWFKFQPLKFWNQMSRKETTTMAIISFLGTCVSLGFYLTAIKIGHLATVSAVAVTSPLFATLLEILTKKKKANRYLLAGLLFFISGFLVLILL
jgi:drug/metabolite transporter (DMT)-like permease